MGYVKDRCATAGTLCKNHDCDRCFEKSFASHPKAEFWVQDMNGTCTPRQILKQSGKKFHFRCKECNHTIVKSPHHIVSLNTWCSYCAHLKLCDNSECTLCFDNSFASVDKCIYWDDKNEKTPRETFKNSKKKAWFHCENCDNKFDKVIGDVTRGSWCMKCYQGTIKVGSTESVKDKTLKDYPHLVGELSDRNGSIDCYTITAGSKQKLWWICSRGHTYLAAVGHRTKSGSACPESECTFTRKVQTNLLKYGCEWPTQNEEVLVKRDKTMLERYGSISPIVNYGMYDHVSPTGKIYMNLQGYEKFFIDNQYFEDHEIRHGRTVLPVFKYVYDDNDHLYYPDFYIPEKKLDHRGEKYLDI